MIKTVDINVTMKVSYEGLSVPTHVIRKTETPQLAASRPVPLAELSKSELDALACDWLVRFYDAAGKRNPWKTAAYRGGDGGSAG